MGTPRPGVTPPRLNRKNLGRDFKDPKSCDGMHGIPKSPTRDRDSGRNPMPPIPAFSLSAIKAGGGGLGFLGTRHGGIPMGFWGPVEKLLGDRVAVVVGHEVDPVAVEAEVAQQPLHDAGLLEDGVAVGSLPSRAGP